MPLTIILNGMPYDFARTAPAGFEVLILKGVTSPGEKIYKYPIGTTSYGCPPALRTPFVQKLAGEKRSHHIQW